MKLPPIHTLLRPEDVKGAPIRIEVETWPRTSSPFEPLPKPVRFTHRAYRFVDVWGRLWVIYAESFERAEFLANQQVRRPL